MERRGSGIKKILEVYKGKKQPEFISTETDFVTIFYNENYKKKNISGRNRDIEEKNKDIQPENEDIGQKNKDIERQRTDFDNLIISLEGNKQTKENMKKLVSIFKEDSIFGRQDVMDTLVITKTPASNLLKKMLGAGLIEPVKGQGKGKYRIAYHL